MIPRRWFASLLVVLLALHISTLQAAPERDDERSYRVYGAPSMAIAQAGAAVEGVGRGFSEISADAATAARLRAQGYLLVPQPTPQVAVDPNYHSYDQMAAEVAAIASAHPEIVSLSSIGTSFEGRSLLAAKVSDNASVDEDEPEVLFVGHYHAREHLTLEMVLYILHVLVDDYTTPSHAEIDALINTREIWLIFDMNPDGGTFDTASGTYRNWRKNRQPNGCSYDTAAGIGLGTDLNRNHSYRWAFDDEGSSPDPCSTTYRGSAAASSPEIAALERFVQSREISGTQQITAAISFHSYGELVLWPYGYSQAAYPDDMRADDYAVFAALGQAMAATNGYTPQQSSELYVTNGDFSDWAYGEHGIFAYTFEMSGYDNGIFYGFYPPGSAILRETARNREAVLLLIRAAACPYTLVNKEATYCSTLAPLQRTWLPVIAQ